MSDNKRRAWAWLVLAIFLAGVALGVYSYMREQNALGLTSVVLLLLGGAGSFVLRKDLDEKHRREAQEEPQEPEEPEEPLVEIPEGPTPGAPQEGREGTAQEPAVQEETAVDDLLLPIGLLALDDEDEL